MKLKAVHIVPALLLLLAAGVTAGVFLGWPGLETARAVSDASVGPDALKTPGNAGPDEGGEGRRGPDWTAMRSNTAVKGDRLTVDRPEPEPPAIPSMALDTAIQFMAVPLTSVPEESAQASVKATNALLDDQQISAIKARLKLTPAQEKYWPPVEQALRQVVTVAHSGRRPTVDPGHDSMKQLVTAARPFLAQLRSDQKEQIKSLMRIAGLGTQLPGAD